MVTRAWVAPRDLSSAARTTAVADLYRGLEHHGSSYLDRHSVTCAWRHCGSWPSAEQLLSLGDAVGGGRPRAVGPSSAGFPNQTQCFPQPGSTYSICIARDSEYPPRRVFCPTLPDCHRQRRTVRRYEVVTAGAEVSEIGPGSQSAVWGGMAGYERPESFPDVPQFEKPAVGAIFHAMTPSTRWPSSVVAFRLHACCA